MVCCVHFEIVHGFLMNAVCRNDIDILFKGNCSIFPLSGFAAQTNFTISCENWMDLDSPLSYEFSYPAQGMKIVLFHRTIASGLAISETDWLGIGDEKNEFKLNVSIVIKDFYGSKTVQVITVQVNKYFSVIFCRWDCLKYEMSRLCKRNVKLGCRV